MIKLFVQEAGSLWMTQVFDSTEDRFHLVSALVSVEVHCTLRRLERARNITPEHCASALTALSGELKRMVEYPVTSAVLEDAMRVSDISNLRSLDAIQLATALHARSLLSSTDTLTLVTSDHALSRAAVREGIDIYDPAEKNPDL